MAKFAENTSVPVERSKSEIEATAMRYGASGFVTGWQGDEAMVSFQIRDRRVRFNLPLPDKNDPTFTDVLPAAEGSGRRSTTRPFSRWAKKAREAVRARGGDPSKVQSVTPWNDWYAEGKFPSEAAALFLGPATKKRDPAEAARLWEQACRQKWRALALAVKAKLEAVESGISSFEEEFMAHIVTSSGRTVGEMVMPNLPSIVQTGKMPKLLPGPERGE